MEKFGEEELCLNLDALRISSPTQSTRGSGRMVSKEGVPASPFKTVVRFLLGYFTRHFDGGGHKHKDGEDSSSSTVLQLREIHAMEIESTKEKFKKLFTQKERELEAAVEEINELLTQKDELLESVSQSDCRNLQLQNWICELEQQMRIWCQERESMQQEALRLEENRLRLEANEGKLHLQIQSLERQRANEGKHKNGSYVDSSATPVLLETLVRGLHMASRNFTKEFVSTNVHGYSSADKLFPGIQFSRRSHVKYAHQAHLSAIFFSDFEREDFGDDAQLAKLSLPHQQPTTFFEEYEAFSNASDFSVSNLLPSKYTEAFSAFCCRKYLGIFHKELDLEESMLQCSQQADGKDSKANKSDHNILTTFFQLARIVWMLHRLAFSFEPNARAIRVGRGAVFNREYMVDVINEDSTRDEEDSVDEDMMPPRVALVVLPGFSVCKCIVKSLVYVTRRQASTT